MERSVSRGLGGARMTSCPRAAENQRKSIRGFLWHDLFSWLGNTDTMTGEMNVWLLTASIKDSLSLVQQLDKHHSFWGSGIHKLVIQQSMKRQLLLAIVHDIIYKRFYQIRATIIQWVIHVVLPGNVKSQRQMSQTCGGTCFRPRS